MGEEHEKVLHACFKFMHLQSCSKLQDTTAKSPTETSVGSAETPQKYFNYIYYSNHY